MKVIVAVFALIVASLAQTDTPCNVPNQFQSRIQQLLIDDSGSCASVTTEGELYFDYPNQRIRIDESASIQEFTYTITAWIDYSVGEAYYYNRDSQVCYHDYVDGYIEEPDIPDGSDFEGTFTIGAVAINTWLTPSIPDVDALEVISVTDSTCFPVTDVWVNTTTEQLSFQQTFWNFLPSLPPFYWDIPSVCQSAKKNVGATVPSEMKPLLVAPFQKNF